MKTNLQKQSSNLQFSQKSPSNQKKTCERTRSFSSERTKKSQVTFLKNGKNFLRKIRSLEDLSSKQSEIKIGKARTPPSTNASSWENLKEDNDLQSLQESRTNTPYLPSRTNTPSFFYPNPEEEESLTLMNEKDQEQDTNTYDLNTDKDYDIDNESNISSDDFIVKNGRNKKENIFSNDNDDQIDGKHYDAVFKKKPLLDHTLLSSPLYDGGASKTKIRTRASTEHSDNNNLFFILIIGVSIFVVGIILSAFLYLRKKDKTLFACLRRL